MKAVLMLEDGTIFEGVSVGIGGEKVGEVILNTAVVGYQEMMTDPANAGKILVLTYPLIGNYGVAKKFYESERCWIAALVIKEKSAVTSNWQAEGTFDDFLKDEGLLAISEVDTRTLAVNIRDKGEMLGIISTRDAKKEDLLKKLRSFKGKNGGFIKDISTKKITELTTGLPGPRIAIIDLGMLHSLLKQLKTLRCNITLLPYNTDADEIIDSGFDGVIISSGPEDDESAPQVVKTIQKLLGKIPLLGISTGHEILALALGGRLKKMKLGHRGVNYPVRSLRSYKGEITVQNHSYVVDEASIKNRRDVEITLRNINDNTIEEMVSESLRFISVGYYPASPGFDEVNDVFNRFIAMTKKKKEKGKICQSAKI